ncbi:MAG: HIRAN domain-containing protein [Reichenbachiella sp.]|uniref:HIRAN domain-containing protein n=1 Tax=Reichenbachiella sp. TaxID=2184521 RepID=UPI003266E7A6
MIYIIVLVLVGGGLFLLMNRGSTNNDSEFTQIEVAGVTYDNEDGSSRQSIINRLNEGDNISLKKEPHNEHDENAVAVLSGKKRIGYIPKSLNKQVINLINHHRIISIVISEIFELGQDYLGIEIELELKEGSLNK